MRNLFPDLVCEKDSNCSACRRRSSSCRLDLTPSFCCAVSAQTGIGGSTGSSLVGLEAAFDEEEVEVEAEDPAREAAER